MRIGLVGAGNIGGHFAARWLDAGHRVVVRDVNPVIMDQMDDLGADAASSLEDLALQVDVVCLSLPLPGTVLEVARGIASSRTRAGLVVDLSTTGAKVTQEVDELLRHAGIAFLSAPVSGGTVAAAQGQLTVMAAGTKAAYEQARPVLEVIGRNLFYLGGDVRLGQSLKLINNTLYAINMIASCEALVCGTKAGLDGSTMLDVINRSSGRSFATLERMQGALDRSFPVRFTMALLRKDVALALAAAQELGVPMHVTQQALHLLDLAIADGLGDADNVAAIQTIERQAGVVFSGAAS
ncbi:NAD(P)-dependent oxidoreductase [Paracidovorax anthurii]|uniref:3-hydroxyisobutyrate dehydrogenase-like beta-hydroxyacid dehydrogenase n=1 Tax=Paracidovorax anthurii TaxID=78229 RepID=A0A328YWI4_9BURK|nr:NAD(P)-dependent oxidoreductase [Paracidovorax anthurii]RAR78180.1 3-hydroxyisobutyrate dehydrogenase/hypothetical protein [Paracidovorax anthurii]